MVHLPSAKLPSANLPFADRLEAGWLLADELGGRNISRDAVILALTHGGVPVGFAIATRLQLPLDVIVVRKIGVPWQPELAMGAIAGSARVFDNVLIRELGIYAEDVEEVVTRERAEMKRREELYRAGRPELELHDRPVILVDDGLATGHTMLAAVRHVRNLKPAKLTVAVPVGSRDACDRIQNEADELLCLAMPEPFDAVGKSYRAFPQVSDAEVKDLLLAENRRRVKKNNNASLTVA